MKHKLMSLVEEAQLKKDVADFEIGDVVDVHQKILEGDKTRIQIFSGVVISRRGEGMRSMFTVRRMVQGEGVERVFPIHSPKIAKIEVKRTGRVRRAKLYYLRDRVGKAMRLRERKDGAEVPSSPTPVPGAAEKAKAPEKAKAAAK
jgi:large subunit ribosomal protein L19